MSASNKIGCALVAALLVSAGSVSAQTFNMKIGNATRADVQYEWQTQMQKRVQERSKGRIKVGIYGSSQLGSINRMIEGVQLGTIESWVGPGEFLARVAAGFQVPGAPGIFKDAAHAGRAVTDPKFREAFLAVGESKGVKGISVFIYGPSLILFSDPVKSLAGFKSKKVRVFGAPIQVEPFKALGGAPLPMNLAEVLPALQRHVIDGSLSSITVFTTFRYWDVAKNLVDTGYQMTVSVGIVSKRWFDSLPHDLQQVVLSVGKELEPEMTAWGIDAANKAKKAWTDHGGKIIQLPAAEHAQMMKTVQAVGEKVMQAQPAAVQLYNLLKDAARRTR
jgi:TRAP-type C4-dicarboxylate transport system substrate-binding protein